MIKLLQTTSQQEQNKNDMGSDNFWGLPPFPRLFPFVYKSP